MKNIIKSWYRFLSSSFQSIHLDYKIDVKPRYGSGKSVHELLNNVVQLNRGVYSDILNSFLKHSDNIHLINDYSDEINQDNPTWNNGFLPGLDIISLYCMIANFKPSKYIEIGSGNSTKVARKAITENDLSTEIISIDPYPRSNIDHLATVVIRKRLELLTDTRFITESLHANDILFIDNSHRVFPNSDAMICFLELLPFLNKGTLIHFHDIYLPYDYPQFMCDRFYNEQYTLAAFILANPNKYMTLLPNYFISNDQELSNIISPIWEHSNLSKAERHGGSYWLQIN